MLPSVSRLLPAEGEPGKAVVERKPTAEKKKQK
jgi:hypothetical protein